VRSKAHFVKSGLKALRPYILVLLDIVLGFGISGQPPRLPPSQCPHLSPEKAGRGEGIARAANEEQVEN